MIYKSHTGRRLYLVFVLTAAAAISESIGIVLLLPLIEAAEAGDGMIDRESILVRAMYHVLGQLGIAGSMIGILLFIGVLFIGKGLLKFAEGAYAGYLRARLMQEIKGKMFTAYKGMDYSYYSSHNTGHFINIINGQVRKFIRSFETFTRFFSMVIMTITYLFIAFFIAWRFALMAVVAGMVLLFLFRYLNRYVQRLSRQTSKEEGQLNHFLVQTMQAFKYLASTARLNHLEGSITGSIRKLAGYMFRQAMAGSFTQAIREPISVLFLLFVIILQVYLFDSPVAPIFVALLLFHRGMQHMIGIQDDWQKTMERIGSLEMVVEEFEKLEKSQEKAGSVDAQPFSESIRLDDVWFSYDDGDPVLQGISLDIPARSMIAFAGESGAGKSTLIDTLTLLHRPQKGRMYIDGVPSDQLNPASWRSQIGYVSQETVVFDDTIANNISLWDDAGGSDEETQHRIKEAARTAFADEFIESLPKGYDTVVGENGIRLSGGQRQRLFIARELFKKPNLLILDEATSALDSESETYIQKSIDALKGSMTVVVIAHRLSTIRDADTIFLIENGRLTEQGSFEELLQNGKGRFREMARLQSLR